jgi:ribosomal protein S18 acetylase RimI-like enzyme
MRKALGGCEPSPQWPVGITPAPFGRENAEDAHALLKEAFADAEDHVPGFEEWWAWLTTDAEYDPELCIVAVDRRATVVGFAQCWTSGFVKDLAVAQHWRRRGLGTCLIEEAFARFARRGLTHVDLKVRAGNTGAQRLYRSLGMVEVETS